MDKMVKPLYPSSTEQFWLTLLLLRHSKLCILLNRSFCAKMSPKFNPFVFNYDHKLNDTFSFDRSLFTSRRPKLGKIMFTNPKNFFYEILSNLMLRNYNSLKYILKCLERKQALSNSDFRGCVDFFENNLSKVVQDHSTSEGKITYFPII